MNTRRKRKRPRILNRGSLMTYRDDGKERCFGYLFEFRGRGIFEPAFGKLGVSSEEAKIHNSLLSKAEIEGLDNRCAVGMRGMFYVQRTESQTIVMTWLGQEVSKKVQVRGSVLTFQRHSMIFRGRLREEEDCFSFKRIH